MVSPTPEQRQLRALLAVTFWASSLLALIYLVAPGVVLGSLNGFSGLLAPALSPIPVRPHRTAWLATVATLGVIAVASWRLKHLKHMLRAMRRLIVPLLLLALLAGGTALGFFFTSMRYFALLAAGIGAGVFGLTLVVAYLRARHAVREALSGKKAGLSPPPRRTGPTVVAAIKESEPIRALDEVLDETRFFFVLERRLRETEKTRETFSIVIKPNFMWMHSRLDVTSFTDPELVKHLIARLRQEGYGNISIVEAQNTYGNYYRNREVVKVAEYVGYSASSPDYRIVDLTEEMVPYDYGVDEQGHGLGMHFVGPTWANADFRISFAKNKTHMFCSYTLTLKNMFGVLPVQNKLKEYHGRREYDWPTIAMLKHFPVHFGFIDAFVSADGIMGVAADPRPNHTQTIIGGENLIAVDWVGAKKMGLDPDDPDVGRFLPLAIEAFGRPEIVWKGDKSEYSPWENAPLAVGDSLDVIEEFYAFSNWCFHVGTAMDEYFPPRPTTIARRLIRVLLSPVKCIWFRHDYLRA